MKRYDAAPENATPTVKRASAGCARQPGPVSMLRWRRQTRAFDDTSASLAATATGDAMLTTPVQTQEPATSTSHVVGETKPPPSPLLAQTSPQREKPVIIAGARGAARWASATRPVEGKPEG